MPQFSTGSVLARTFADRIPILRTINIRAKYEVHGV
jgi:hypothetical protein